MQKVRKGRDHGADVLRGHRRQRVDAQHPQQHRAHLVQRLFEHAAQPQAPAQHIIHGTQRKKRRDDPDQHAIDHASILRITRNSRKDPSVILPPKSAKNNS